VVSGYKLELTSPSFQTSQPVTVVGKDNHGRKLLEKGAIKTVSLCPNQFVSRIFLVPKKDGSFRPVINLRPLNRFIVVAHFKMDNLTILKDLLQPEEWMASIDLKDAYLSVVISEEHRKYLRFTWNSKLFEFMCLPFGLCSVPRVFTSLYWQDFTAKRCG